MTTIKTIMLFATVSTVFINMTPTGFVETAEARHKTQKVCNSNGECKNRPIKHPRPVFITTDIHPGQLELERMQIQSRQ